LEDCEKENRTFFIDAFLYYAIRQSQGKLMISSGKKASDP